jgi:hypothetical protein
MQGLVRLLGSFLPEPLRQQLEREMPAISVSLMRLALEVVAAEQQGISYRDACERIDFPQMASVHHGLLDQLQSQPPQHLRAFIRTLIDRAEAGDFDSARKLLFEIACRADAEAAFARFLLFQAVRLNLYFNTWELPLFEAWGSIDRVERKAERVLRELLDLEEMHHRDVRPLHVLVKEMLMHLEIDADLVRERVRQRLGGFVEKAEMLACAHGHVRALDARDAAVFRPGRSPEKLGSQRIADRYPHHFATANAVDQRRRRLRRRQDPDQLPVPSGDRLIDIMLDAVKDKEQP